MKEILLNLLIIIILIFLKNKFTDNYNTDIPEKIGVVKFNNASFYITDGAYSCYRWIDINVEVIGNIYENNDLLEEE